MKFINQSSVPFKKIILNTIAASVLVATSGCALMSGSAGSDKAEDVYVSLKGSGQVAKYPGQEIWQGAPVMLYNAITPDGKRLVVSSPKKSTIYIFDTDNGKIIAQVKVGKASKGLKISPNGKEVYVANEGADSISVVSLDDYTVLATIDTEDMPHNVRFNNDGTKAYVTLQGGAGLGVIDTKTRKVIKVMPTPGLTGAHNLDLSKDEKIAFIRDTVGNVGVMDLKTGDMKKIIKVGIGHAGIDVIPNGKLVFTGAIADDVVTVIDATTYEVIKKIKVGFGPHGVRATKNNEMVYVTVTADNKVEIIDIKTLTVVKRHSVEDFPFWVAVNGNP